MKYIEHSRPTIGREEKTAVMRVLESNFIGEGKEVRHLEEELSSYVGSKGGVAASTGTMALHLALVALGVGKGAEVIAPSYVCRSVLNALDYCGAKVRLCDVNEHDYNISFIQARKKVTKKTKAVIVPHMYGCPAEIDKFKQLGLFIIEDCAHSIGSQYKGKMVGSQGDLAVFSFEGTKYIVAGQGGMVTANSVSLLNRLRGLKEPDALDFRTKYTYRMTDLQAAVGRAQLSRLEVFIQKRITIAKRYSLAFSDLDVELPFEPLNGKHTFHRYMIKIRGDINTFMQRCYLKGVKVKQPVKPMPLHRYMGLPIKDFPNTEKIMSTSVSIPIYPTLTDEQIALVSRVVRDSL